jgi:hypothetical protein
MQVHSEASRQRETQFLHFVQDDKRVGIGYFFAFVSLVPYLFKPPLSPDSPKESPRESFGGASVSCIPKPQAY